MSLLKRWGSAKSGVIMQTNKSKIQLLSLSNISVLMGSQSEMISSPNYIPIQIRRNPWNMWSIYCITLSIRDYYPFILTLCEILASGKFSQLYQLDIKNSQKVSSSSLNRQLWIFIIVSRISRKMETYRKW